MLELEYCFTNVNKAENRIRRIASKPVDNSGELEQNVGKVGAILGCRDKLRISRRYPRVKGLKGGTREHVNYVGRCLSRAFHKCHNCLG